MRTSNIVDRFHWEKHKHRAHPNLEEVCKQFCNPEVPAKNPKNVDLFDAQGKRIFYSEMQESIANYLGPYQKIFRSMSALHAKVGKNVVYTVHVVICCEVQGCTSRRSVHNLSK